MQGAKPATSSSNGSVGSSSSRSSGRRSSRRDEGGMAIRKGTWMAEEDEILMEYVRKHGPRDWSSIRSKGLLARTGKSCRLRWVNKLKPDLKTGCKFSPEEERIVLDLQAKFGNKWARIATYLPGRTDNDVKNFWSTRQKRLARISRSSLPPRSSKNDKELPAVSSYEAPPNMEVSLRSSNVQCGTALYVDNQYAMSMAPSPCNLGLGTALPPLLEPATEEELLRLPNTSMPPQPPPPQQHIGPLPQPSLDYLDHFTGEEICFSEEFGCQGSSPCMQFLYDGSPFAREDEQPPAPDSLFDDLPSDLFDYLEPPPPPPPTSSAS
uniref:Uncharacterized protein n=1 Tax=Musa acuminata subsp. malaccensis TaxID=214687 RepID=A0A804IRS0_MUSAM